jgi:hypothetical protein
MRRRAFLGGMLGIASLRIDRAFANPALASITVNGTVVPTMQAAADIGGRIFLSRGVLAAQVAGVAIGAAHFRKPAMVAGQGTQIADQSIEDKGTFVVDADASFTGLDIAGATGDGIGAAFRHQSGNLLVRRTKIHRCQNGLLGPARFVDCALVVDDCDVFDNGTGTGQTHGLYVGAISEFTCNNSRFRATDIGHHIKSRARRTTISDCQVGTDFMGTESYNVDVPQGGEVTIVGSHMRQGPHTDNNAMLNFGGERDPYSGGSLVVTGTAFESTAGGTGIRIHPNADVTARLENCMFIGLDVPVDGRCEVKNCRHDGRLLPDRLHLRGAPWR